MIRETFSLSGFGGGYEAACQMMLWAGVKYLEDKNPPTEIWKDAKSSPNIYGVVLTEGDHLKAIEDEFSAATGNDYTGAMHHCVLGHLAFIHQKGLNKWTEEMKDARDRSFQWDDEKAEFVGDSPSEEH